MPMMPSDWNAKEMTDAAKAAEIPPNGSAAGKPEPEIIPPGVATSVDDPEPLILDPAKIRVLSVKILRSVVYHINRKLDWKELPDQDWADQTIQAAEMIYKKYAGEDSQIGPEALLVFNVLGAWILPNNLDKIKKLMKFAQAEEPPKAEEQAA